MSKPYSNSSDLLTAIPDSRLGLLLAYCNAEGGSQKTLPSPDEEDAFLELAGRHGVLPLLYRSVMEGVADRKGSFYGKLRRLYHGVARQNMLMSAELLAVLRLLKEQRIGVLALKGPALALEAYGDLTLRQFGDLDLLVHAADRDRALELLESAGWQSEIELRGERRRRVLEQVNVLGLQRRSNGVRLELHWGLFPRNYALEWGAEIFRRKAAHVELQGVRVPVPRPEMHLLYLCAHGSKHLYRRLEWLTDIDRFIRSHPALEWSEILSEAQKTGIRRMLLLSLFLSRNLLGTPLHSDLIRILSGAPEIDALSRRLLSGWSAPETAHEDGMEFLRLHLAMREGLRERSQFLAASLFSPKFDDFRSLDLPPRLSFAYSFLRPLRLIRKYLFT